MNPDRLLAYVNGERDTLGIPARLLAYSVTCPTCQSPPGSQCVGVFCPVIYDKPLRDPHYSRLVEVGAKPPAIDP